MIEGPLAGGCGVQESANSALEIERTSPESVLLAITFLLIADNSFLPDIVKYVVGDI